MYYRIY